MTMMIIIQIPPKITDRRLIHENDRMLVVL